MTISAQIPEILFSNPDPSVTESQIAGLMKTEAGQRARDEAAEMLPSVCDSCQEGLCEAIIVVKSGMLVLHRFCLRAKEESESCTNTTVHNAHIEVWLQ